MNSIKINLDQLPSEEVKIFQAEQRRISDLEHYWKEDIDFTKREYTFVAKDNSDTIVWTIVLSIEVNLCFIEGLLVSSKHRRLGIWTSLIRKAENHAIKQKCSKIYLETNEGWQAVKFYENIWYKVTWSHEEHMMGQKALFFTKFL